MQRSIDITGQRFGRLIALTPVGKNSSGTMRWACKCDCGAETVTTGTHLRAGRQSSCGCLQRETSTKHGMYKSAEHRVWRGMLARCHTATNTRFAYYGGRGISVCAEWQKSFAAFYAHMGPRPSVKHTVERNDVNGPYSPNNCRWATMKEQSRNRRNNVHHTAFGFTLTLPEWAERLGVPIVTLRKRLTSGHAPENAFTDRNLRYGSMVQSKRRSAQS